MMPRYLLVLLLVVAEFTIKSYAANILLEKLENSRQRNIPQLEDKQIQSEELDGRIIGGTPIDIRFLPHQISLQYNEAHICGGTIIKPDLIMTAAHCIENVNQPTMYSVRAGSSFHMWGGQVVTVQSIRKNPKYSTSTLSDDVAVLRLSSNLTLNSRVKSIELAAADDILTSAQNLIISGWGLIDELDNNVTPILRYAIVHLIDRDTCATNYRSIFQITDDMFCAGSTEGGKDSCQGDSGGPLISYDATTGGGTRDDSGAPKLYGIVSWGIGCGHRDYPGVYAKIPALRKWIDEAIVDIGRGE